MVITYEFFLRLFIFLIGQGLDPHQIGELFSTWFP